MNIIAVIPARAGSKGVVNKNIRLIHGKPMISYVIENAIKSKYISKIIISTDSEDVKLIAKQYENIKIVERSSNLTTDDVTLDDVILDAIKDEKQFDYCVTLQATSPTLNFETLDCAIEKIMNEDIDTIISAKNDPHLSWKFEGEQIVPNYTERLNRQYLPHNLVETGAFLISSYESIKKKLRIDGNIQVFEISEKESVDVDTHADMVVAKNILEKNKVAFYVNGSRKIGLGHIYRCLELADEIDEKVTIFFDKKITNTKLFGNTMNTLVSVDDTDHLLKLIKEGEFNYIINDVLNTTDEYISKLKNIKDLKIINIEDEGSGALKADIVVNALLDSSEHKHIFTGHKYFICNKNFLYFDPIKIKKKVNKVIVGFGGADPSNYSEQFIKIVNNNPKFEEYDFTLLIGSAKALDFVEPKSTSDNLKILIDVKNMPEIMSNSDVGVVSRGRMAYELALLGIPTASLAQNKREQTHNFVNEENGYTYFGRDITDTEFENKLQNFLNTSYEERLDVHEIMKSKELVSGRIRFINLMKTL